MPIPDALKGAADLTAELKQQFVEILPHLRAFARSLCGQQTLADDLVQETVLKAWAARDSFREGTNFKAWAFTILRNTYYSHMRTKKREVEDVDGVLVARLTALPDQEDKIELQDVKRALMALPDSQREALILVAASGFSYEEAASISGCATGTMKSRVNRARKNLLETMG